MVPHRAAKAILASASSDFRYVFRSMSDYHQIVISGATLFGDFTVWCGRTDSQTMNIQDLRRHILRAYIDARFSGNVSRFAQEAKKQQSQVADMLDGRKAFGERIARTLEGTLRLPRGYFDREEALDPDLAALLRHWNFLVPEARLRVLHFAKLEHASQFTGSPEARAEHERQMKEYTSNHKENHGAVHEPVQSPYKKRGR